MTKTLILAVQIAIFAAGASAYAACDKTVKPFLNADKGELSLHIKDVRAVPNACDYVARRLEYVDAIKTLLVEVQEQPCFVDRTGKRSVNVKWVLPTALRGDGAIQLILNGRKTGAISLKSGQVAYEADADCAKN